jgi:uncharacterized protein YndB with AHSA1/START domain
VINVAKNMAKIKVEPGKLEILVEREFEAPRELVFKALTHPELYAQWVGPRGFSTTIETFEPRNGGFWRFIQKDQEDNEFVFHGVYHEVSPERIISTFEFEGLPEPGHVLLDTLKLKELPGNRTKLTDQSVFQSVDDRDGMMQSGMEQGIDESYERLDELLEKLKK